MNIIILKDIRNNIIFITYMEYYYDVIGIKKYFISNCKLIGIISLNETYKLWANFILLNLKHSNIEGNIDNHIIIPNILENNCKNKMISLLCEKGSNNDKAQQFYEKFMAKIEILYNKYKNRIFDPSIIKINYYNFVLYCDNIKLTINQILYDKLQRLFINHKYIYEYMFEMLFNYDILDGLSLQWSIPDKIFTIVTGELFASPINCHIENNYYSLFSIDKFFGSKGNIFNVLTLENGIYEINPPFIEKIFDETINLVNDNLNNENIIFIYIMPNWTDSNLYQILDTSKYKKNKFIYKIGTHQYIDIYNKNIQASFDTHVFILSSSLKNIEIENKDIF